MKPQPRRLPLVPHRAPRLAATAPNRLANFWYARNTLTQKGQGPVSTGTVKLDLSHLAAEGQPDGALKLVMRVLVDAGPTETRATQTLPARGEFDLAFDWRTGTFQGEQFALFCYNPSTNPGFADIDWFKFNDSLPADSFPTTTSAP